MPTLFRTDQARVQVDVTGVQMDTTSWDVMQGGDKTADTINYLPGGMVPAINLGGLPKRGDLTVERIWSDTLINVFKQLDNVVGKAPVQVTYVVLDANGIPLANPNASIKFAGILKGVTRPNYDSNTTSEAKLQIVVALDAAIH